MTTLLRNYVADRWVATSGTPQPLRSAITGEVVAEAGAEGLDFAGMLDHARRVGGPALRAMTFHQRAHMVKALGQAIMDRKEELYALNWATGATRQDGWIDIEGGAGTLFTTSSKARRELPDDVVIDATNLQRGDRLANALVAPRDIPVEYVLIDRPQAEKIRDAGWRAGKPGLMDGHARTFARELPDILAGDGLPNVTVKDLRTSA